VEIGLPWQPCGPHAQQGRTLLLLVFADQDNASVETSTDQGLGLEDVTMLLAPQGEVYFIPQLSIYLSSLNLSSLAEFSKGLHYSGCK
jgi:hypothetical protein